MPIKRYTDRTGREITEAEAFSSNGIMRDGVQMSEVLADGERVSMSAMFMDGLRRVLDTQPANAFLRDAAGIPVTLVDRSSGSQLKLTADHITAIEAEAAKAGMGVSAYVADVLRYAIAS